MRTKWIAAIALSLVLALGGGLAQAGTATWALDSDAGRQNWGTVFAYFGTATMSSSYAASGDTLTAASVGMRKILSIVPLGGTDSGYTVLPALSGTGALLKVMRTGQTGDEAQTVTIVHDATAAATGTAVYADRLSGNGLLCGLESINAGLADSAFTTLSGGDTGAVEYQAAPGGVQIYIDEDEAVVENRVQAVLLADCYVPLSDGSMLKVAADAGAAAEVALYFDDNAANTYERLMFVSPTTTDMTGGTSASYSLNVSAPAEVTTATDLSSETFPAIVIGR